MRTLLALVILLSVLAPAAHAATYQVNVTGGSTFTTRYAPKLADFDPNLLMFLSDQSNWVSLPVELVSDIVVVEEALGFGTVIDDKTIMIGFMPNDNLSPEEQAELDAAGGPELPAESYTGGGIPVGFLNVNTPPMGRVGGGGRVLSNDRRSGGGGIIDVEPSSRY